MSMTCLITLCDGNMWVRILVHESPANEIQPYYNFYRVDMHSMLMQGATGPGDGQPAVLKLNHACKSVDHETGTVRFQNATSARHDLVIGADGVGVSSPFLWALLVVIPPDRCMNR